MLFCLPNWSVATTSTKFIPKPIGTGAYTFGSWDPGVSANVKRYADHWNKDRGHVDEVNFTCINDTAQRMIREVDQLLESVFASSKFGV